MASYVELSGVSTWYDDLGAGEPLVVLHPGMADARAFGPNLAAFIEQVVGGPVHLVGMSDGATVALVTALRRSDLVRRLVLVAGVFHRAGWAPGVIHSDAPPPDFMRDAYAEVSPDGVEHFPIVAYKLARLHDMEPRLEPGTLHACWSKSQRCATP